MPKPKPTDATVSPGAAAESSAGAAQPPPPNADGLPETAGAEVAGAAAESTVNDAGAGAATVDTGPSPPPAADETAAQTPDETADQTPNAAPSAEMSADELRAQLESNQAENAAMKDRLLRAKAEVENIRRRSQNEIAAARKFAIEGFAKELLEVKDNLDRAAAVELDAGAGAAVRQMKEGLGLTLKQLDLALARFAVSEVEAAPGVKFDPQRHQAVSATPSAEVAADHIVTVVQKGFALRERLLRPAMVVVAAADKPA
ncbi:MAG: nucleotide exchange factor GrpE [Gammaproteobacteria bacterium]|nr:nucleotide exchange factor GrpE [Gammaproteobacteria bacterium]